MFFADMATKRLSRSEPNFAMFALVMVLRYRFWEFRPDNHFVPKLNKFGVIFR